ncbi:MAG: DUF2089 domain-containing protein [Elusimicrobiales bacterium]|nr:DUF2089 domain-containing protein [Elusimicrobiales bacterium]
MNIPTKCPACDGDVIITEMACAKCKTSIKGSFELNELAALSEDDLAFLKVFISARGSIKEVEKNLGISYPTVRAKLDALIKAMGLSAPAEGRGQRKAEIIGRLERGEIDAQAALKLLKELEGENI